MSNIQKLLFWQVQDFLWSMSKVNENFYIAPLVTELERLDSQQLRPPLGGSGFLNYGDNHIIFLYFCQAFVQLAVV